MAEFDVKTGHDTWVAQGTPTAVNGTGRFPALKAGASGQFRTFVNMPLSASRIGGKTIISAILSVPVQGNWVDQTVTVQACATSRDFATMNWNNQPGVVGATASSGATGALAAGQRVEIDVTALVQAIADGQANYGWRLITSQSTHRSTVRGFDSGLAEATRPGWTLHVEVSDAPQKPAQLSPAGVIATDKPILVMDEQDDISQIQVQVDADKTAAFDFDSGWVAVTKPQLDLTATAYAGLADGATTFWRGRTKGLNGAVSSWSDWVEITREDQPVIVMDNPSGTDLWDVTPSIAAHLSPAGTADTRWQVIVTAVGDPTDVRYNSGDALDGATLDHQIPLRWKNRKVFPVDGNYRLVVKAWDRTDRVPTIGFPAFVREVIVVTLDADNLLDPVDTLTLSQATSGYPDITLNFTRAVDPDYGFVVERDGEIIVFLDVDEFRINPGEWEWLDESAAPNVTHTYKVRPVVDDGGVRKRGAASPEAEIFAEVSGVWIRSDLGDIMLYGPPPEVTKIAKRVTYALPYRPEPVDIVTAPGTYVCDRHRGTVDDTTPDLLDTLVQIDALAEIPTAEVRMVWSTHNIWVHLRDLFWSASEHSIKTHPIYDVTFGFYEIDPRD